MDILRSLTPTPQLLCTALLSLATGYLLGARLTDGLLAPPNRGGGHRRRAESEESSEEDIDASVTLDNAPNWANGEAADRRQGLKGGPAAASQRERREKKRETATDAEECKLVLVVRTDLGMSRGERLADS
jgi:PTH2 family peptidyl-tRNA hydrolase